MNVEIKRISKNEKQILSNLLQLYLSNISLYFQMEMDQKTGLYIYDDISKYIEDNKNNFAFIILFNNKIAGFTLVDIDKNSNVVQEMFILNEYKRKGIGSIAIKQIFEKFKGNWMIKSLPCSDNAEIFWKNVVKEYTNNIFNIEYVGKFNRAVITFTNEE